jgi:L-iditol 2-dehydrogenase
MRQANLVEPTCFEIQTVEVPTPAAHEVLIRVEKAGICGSDVHAYYGKHPFITCPVVPGHEFVGTVEAVGGGSDDLIGKRVTVLPSLVCGECDNCRTGRSNICNSLRVMGCQSTGAFADYVLAPRDLIFVLPDDMSWDQGVLIEPLAVAVHGVQRVERISGKSVLVLGAGTIGLMTIAVLSAYGAGKIIVSDLNDKRLELAKEFGADVVVNPARESLADVVRQQTQELDVVIECVGIGETINQGIVLLRKGGDLVVAGVFEEDVVVKMGLVQDKEIRMIGTLMYDHRDYFEAIRLMSQRPELTKIITDRFELAQVDAAYQQIAKNAAQSIKVLIEIAAGAGK